MTGDTSKLADELMAFHDAVARTIDGVAFRPQHISGEGLSETEKEKWLRARSVAYYKADQILALPHPDRLIREALEYVRLEARPADDSEEWTEIFPAQLEWVAKQGHQVRAIEIPIASPGERQ